MKQIITAIIAVTLIMTIPMTAASGKGDMATILPSFKDWTPKGKPAFYTPDNLFEYINGAADVFLSYDFEKLASLTYENAKKHTFTMDVYRHSDERNGFGIYSQEKPEKGEFLNIGAQGYYEKGVLNFLKGSYYVKIAGFDLGDNDRKVLTMAAEILAKKLEGSKTFPAVLSCFPIEGKKTNTERYIAQNFLGHSFLNSAFVADYKIKDQKFQLFIIQKEKAENVNKMLDSYLAFAKKKGQDVFKKDNFVRFQDPYYRRSGKMNMKKSGKYIWGLFSKDDAAADSFIAQIEKNLKKQKLI